MYIVLAIILFGVLIASHELGHFLAAKACGVKVLEFALGMGPTLLKKQGKETLYSLRLLPIGGFCAMEGEDEASGDPRAFTSQRAIKRVFILCAGAAANFVLGLLLIILVFTQASSFGVPTISGFMDGCPYEGEDGLLAGDTIYKLDGHRIYFASNVSEYIERSSSDYHDLIIIRDGEKLRLDNFHMTLREYEQEDGTAILRYGLYFKTEQAGGLINLKYAWLTALDFVRMIWHSLGDLVTGAVGLKELSGPVGIVDVVNTAASQEKSTMAALTQVAYLFALIAVNLAVMNMLPIPALDGGRVFFLILTCIIEKISRRKLDPRYEGYIHTAGFVLLMGLMAFVMFSDVIKIVLRR